MAFSPAWAQGLGPWRLAVKNECLRSAMQPAQRAEQVFQSPRCTLTDETHMIIIVIYDLYLINYI